MYLAIGLDQCSKPSTGKRPQRCHVTAHWGLKVPFRKDVRAAASLEADS
jgi:hypothetical protein